MLLNVNEVTEKVLKLDVRGKERLELLPVHISSDMLPMSHFFSMLTKGQMVKGLYGYAYRRILRTFEADRALAVMWFVLAFYENEGVDLTTDNTIWPYLTNEEASQSLLNNYK